jgi:hypothetical protein
MAAVGGQALNHFGHTTEHANPVLGIDMKEKLHTSEVESIRDNDTGELAVHIGAGVPSTTAASTNSRVYLAPCRLFAVRG